MSIETRKPTQETDTPKTFGGEAGEGCGCAATILALAIAFNVPAIIELLREVFAK